MNTKTVTLTIFSLLAVMGVAATAQKQPSSSKAAEPRQAAGGRTPAASSAKKPVKRTPQKPAARRAARPAVKPKAAAASKARLTPADAAGIRDARPGSLKAMALAVLERNSLAEQQKLEAYARQHAKETNGALARLVLGYHAYQKKRYPDARLHFDAARQTASPVQDYAEYYLAMTSLAEGDRDAAIKTLDGFAQRHPGSSLIPSAVLRQAEALVSANRVAEAIPLLATPPALLPQTVADLLLAEAYRKNGQPDKALPLLRTIYYLHPASAQASSAERHLNELRLELGASYPEPTRAMRQERADRLFAGNRWKEAEGAYRALVPLLSGAERDRARVRAGVCQFRAGNSRGALLTLRSITAADPEADAERIYNLGAIYRRLDQPQAMEEHVQLLGRRHPQSDWYQRALFMNGNHYLVSGDPGRAAEYYTRVYQKFPQGELAAESHWRVAWRRYRERNLPEARRLFQEHIQNYSSSSQISAAIYWAGRTLEAETPADAAVFYNKLASTFPNYYYGQVARVRMEELIATQPLYKEAVATSLSPAAALLEPVRRPVPDGLDLTSLSPAIQNRREKARLLESAWLIDLAIEELRSGITSDYASNYFLGRELAYLEQARGRYNVGLSYGKRLISGYFAFDFSELPRQDWELLFPLPWWSHIRQNAEALDLDPYLVAGLIRQESEFNPVARSRSNAYGLMQLLPPTARRMASQMPGGRGRPFQMASLTRPEHNVAYGTFYLRKLLNQFNGSLEQSLAGYNAGENRVVKWLQDGNYEEPAEFVESIPFTETREYVQAVLRNAALYRKLYLDESQAAAPGAPVRRIITATSASDGTADETSALPAARCPDGAQRC